jgi:nicotinamidase-related amidase
MSVAVPAEDVLVQHSRSFALEPRLAALLVIDMQYASACRTTGYGRWLESLGRATDGEYRFSRIETTVTPNIRRLLAWARDHDMARVFVRLGSQRHDFADMSPHNKSIEIEFGNAQGQREFEFLDELAPEPGEPIVNKVTASAFTSTGIDLLLRHMGVSQLILTGVSTSQCVDLTARDAADRGYECVVVEDAVAEDRPEFHEWTLTQFVRLFGRVLDTEAVLSELSGQRAA